MPLVVSTGKLDGLKGSASISQLQASSSSSQRHATPPPPRALHEPQPSKNKDAETPPPPGNNIAASSSSVPAKPVLEPYMARLERFELFSTNQCYYLVGCNKLNTCYRVLKMDRTMIERPADQPPAQTTTYYNNNNSHEGYASSYQQHSPHPYAPQQQQQSAHSASSLSRPFVAPDFLESSLHNNNNNNNGMNSSGNNQADNSHAAKPTLRNLSEFLTEDPNVYSQEEIKDMLDMIHDGNRMMRTDGGGGGDSRGGAAGGGSGSNSGGLKPIVKAYGVVGFIRFLDCYYLTLITRRAKVGSIGDNGIYTIKNTETIPLKPSERRPGSDDNADPSSVLLSMWNRGKRSVGLGLTNREIAELRYQGLFQVVDLTKNFYFAYTYDLTRSLQENFLATTTKPFPPPPFNETYAWNHFLTREFEGCLTSTTSYHWIMPITHGAFVQRRVNDYGRYLNIILLARRSRHFAGTRYLKRGVSEQGKVANDVEHEQILHDETVSSPGTFSSYLQVRGSIPTYWTQESSVTMPKPPIELNRVDPTYTATQLHFADLFQRYSSPILVLDLVKQSEKREREVLVGNEFRHAIDYINRTIDDEHKIRYCALDYSHISKHRNLDVSYALNEVSTWAVNQTGFFCSAPKWKIEAGGTVTPFTEEDGCGASRLSEQLRVPVFPMEQNGVLRTNCIDCLDRTNVAQFSTGVEAIGQQLVAMGIRSRARLEPTSSIVRVLIDMYVSIGDDIALQYGGSEAHKKVTAGRADTITGPIGKHKELLTSIRRYYSNAFTDRLKQDAMNLFLGYYLPYRHSVPLWEIENDYHLHNKAGRGTSVSMKTYERAFGIDWTGDMVKPGPRKALTLAQQRLSASSRTPSGPQVSFTCEAFRHGDESKRVALVRNRCNTQNVALSKWWKIALRSYIKQRMWKRLPEHDEDCHLPPRFERIYQPEKLGQFDRIFSRAWETPVRQSHAAQHSEGVEDDEITDFTRVIALDSAKSGHVGDKDVDSRSHDGTELRRFVEERGFDPCSASTLQSFGKYFEVSGSSNFEYIGQNQVASIHPPPDEYLRYCTPSSHVFGQPQLYQRERVEEFKNALHEHTLSADNVSGIRELARSAHLSEKVYRGEYRGLDKSTSAIEVATAIHEQFNSLESSPIGGDFLVERELERRGLNTAGVVNAVSSGWETFRTSEQQYMEVVNANGSRCQRSDLTNSASLELYASVFDGNTNLSTADRIFLQAATPDSFKERKPVYPSLEPTEPSSFVKKAARLGIAITSHCGDSKSVTPSLYQFSPRHDVPVGFEQINDEMFARKDNKFMVFNGAGVDSWTGTQPITKVSQAESILLSTFS